MRVIESLIVPRSPDERTQDRLFLGSHFVAVVDGATSKGRTAAEHEAVHLVADTVCAQLGTLRPDAAIAEFASAASDAVREAIEQRHPGADWFAGPPSAGALVYSGHRREIWVLGDGWVGIDGTFERISSPAEAALAEVRALRLHELLLAGVSVELLRQEDQGRDLIRPVLEGMWRFRNSSDSPYPVVQIDGRDIPRSLLRVVALSSDVLEIVLATDGYLGVGATVDEAEARTTAVLRADPLLIGAHKATKGVVTGAQAHDDRTWVRVEVEPAV